jgi:DNA-binding GntR family transcriptional regulator
MHEVKALRQHHRGEMTIPNKLERVVVGERLRDQVYRHMRSEMRLGLLTPGKRLKEVELAQRLGVSRTPVREALFQLARDGLLQEQGQGYQLIEHTQQMLRDRMEIRLLLEPSIARRAALGATARQRAKLRKALEREIETVDADEARQFLAANFEFRTALFEICPNKLLVSSAELFDDQFQYSRLEAFAMKGNRQITIDRHEEICTAVNAGDGDGAEAAMHALIEAAWKFHFAGAQQSTLPAET